MQKIDKELESALATLEKEKEEALKDLDAQVYYKSSLQIYQICYALYKLQMLNQARLDAHHWHPRCIVHR